MIKCYRCGKEYDEDKGDGYCGLCPKCADETEPVTVGDLRQRTALSNANNPVIIISDDKDLPDLEVVEVYPDTVDGKGHWGSTFKIKVKRASSACRKEAS